MKRTIIASILGVAACAAVNSSYGQGTVLFVNYGSSGGSAYSAPVTYGSLAGPVVGSDFSAELLYSPTGAAGTFTALASSITPFYGTGNGDTADGGGWFVESGQSINAYGNPSAAVPEYFEVYAYNNDVFAGHAIGTINGTSAVVELGQLADAANLGLPGDLFSDNAHLVGPGLQPFFVTAVPEPTTLAMLGLGGLASLLAFRRKQS
jgi:hypothetical protein